MAGFAAERASTRHLTDLAEEVADLYAALNDPQEYAAHDIRFRRAIARAAGNPILDDMLEKITTHLVDHHPQITKPSSNLRRSAEMHRDVYRAIRSRNAVEAKELMEEILRYTFFGEPGTNSRRLPPRTAGDSRGRHPSRQTVGNGQITC